MLDLQWKSASSEMEAVAVLAFRSSWHQRSARDFARPLVSAFRSSWHHRSARDFAKPLQLFRPLRNRCSYHRASNFLSQSSMAEPNSFFHPKSSDENVANITAAYKTEVIGGCEVQHKDLLYKNIKIHFVECGNLEGQLVLLVHGFPNFWFVWKNQFKVLAEAGFHVVAPDLRGYNSSSKPDGVENYGRIHVLLDMVHLIDACGAGKAAIMVGHDWGGSVTWALAEDFPSRLSKIVIVNSPHWTSFRTALHSSMRQQLRSWYIFFFQLPWIPEALIRFSSFRALRMALKNGPCKPQSEEDINRHVRAYSAPGTVTAAVNYYRAAYAGHWFKNGTNIIELPVTVIWGELDKYLGIELADPPRDLVPDTTILQIPQVSHWPMWDEPEVFNQLLLRALS